MGSAHRSNPNSICAPAGENVGGPFEDDSSCAGAIVTGVCSRLGDRLVSPPATCTFIGALRRADRDVEVATGGELDLVTEIVGACVPEAGGAPDVARETGASDGERAGVPDRSLDDGRGALGPRCSA